MKKYYLEFDYMRVFAALSVISIHTTGWFIDSKGQGYIWNQLVRYAVPVFIILSGLLLFNSAKGGNSPDVRTYMSKRLGKVLIPYVCWTVIYYIYTSRTDPGIVSSLGPSNLQVVLRHLLYGTAAFHLYFIFIIIQFYILFPLLRSIFLRYPRTLLIVSFIITVFFQTADYLVYVKGIYLIPDSPISGIPYFMMFPMWIFYFVLGMFISLRLEAFSSAVMKYKLVIGAGWVISTAVLVAENKLTGTYSFSAKPSIIFYSLMSFAALYILMVNVKGRVVLLDKLMKWTSVRAFMIYLIHPLIIALLLIFIDRFGINLIMNSKVGIYIFFVLTCISSAIVTYILGYLPFAAYLGGARNK